MGKIDFSVGEFDTRVELYSPELKQTVSGAVEKNFTVRGVVELMRRSDPGIWVKIPAKEQFL